MINKINKNIIYGFLSGIISSILLSFTPLIYIEIINKILKMILMILVIY